MNQQPRDMFQTAVMAMHVNGHSHRDIAEYMKCNILKVRAVVDPDYIAQQRETARRNAIQRKLRALARANEKDIQQQKVVELPTRIIEEIFGVSSSGIPYRQTREFRQSDGIRPYWVYSVPVPRVSIQELPV